MMPMKDLLEGCRQILEQMQAVGDLRGCWISLPNARGIGFCSVPGDHRGRQDGREATWPRLQPLDLQANQWGTPVGGRQ